MYEIVLLMYEITRVAIYFSNNIVVLIPRGTTTLPLLETPPSLCDTSSSQRGGA
jgi:hypothetical protein